MVLSLYCFAVVRNLSSFIFYCVFLTGEFETMSRVYVGNLDPRVTERELEDEFRVYGVIRR